MIQGQPRLKDMVQSIVHRWFPIYLCIKSKRERVKQSQTLIPTIWKLMCGSHGDLAFSRAIFASSASWSYVIGPTLMSITLGCRNGFVTSSSFRYSTNTEQVNTTVISDRTTVKHYFCIFNSRFSYVKKFAACHLG